MSFAPEYVSTVLAENFDDAKTLLVEPLVAIHYAHLVMLAERGIVTRDDAHLICKALDGVSPDAVRQVTYDGTCEDLFFYVERLLEAACGEEVAGRLHTARSRNDIDMTMYRMRQRGWILGLTRATLDLRDSLVGVADRHRQTVFPACTHTQPAQPTTVAHYLLGAIEQLERDAIRLRAAYATTNRNPLGSCAITGTSFPIDRHRTSELLGFSGPTGNTYGSIATVDYLLESLAATSVLLVGVGRLLQDLLLWCTADVAFLRLSDGYVQTSSIMPQKRNPVALEHARALASKALAEAQGVTIAAHNTPFGDIVDTEDDLQPLVHAAFRDATRAVSLLAAAMAGADVNVERMRQKAGENLITVTELADTLTRHEGLAFRTAHEVAAKFVARLHAGRGMSRSQALSAASVEVLGKALAYTDAELDDLLSPEHFVSVRKTLGGPAPSEVSRAIAAARRALQRDRLWLDDAITRLAAASERLKAEAAAL